VQAGMNGAQVAHIDHHPSSGGTVSLLVVRARVSMHKIRASIRTGSWQKK